MKKYLEAGTFAQAKFACFDSFIDIDLLGHEKAECRFQSESSSFISKHMWRLGLVDLEDY